MKRGIRALALTLALLLTLGAAALAVETGAVSVTTKNGVTVTPTAEACSVTFKEDSSALSLTYQNSDLANDMVLLLVLKNTAENTAPAEKDILYIDQTTADADGKVSFDTVYPASYQNGKICLISSEGKTKDVATIAVSYQLGDVNEDGKINTLDAMRILQYVVKRVKLSDSQLLAANVNGDSTVNTLDAMRILQFVVHRIESLN